MDLKRLNVLQDAHGEVFFLADFDLCVKTGEVSAPLSCFVLAPIAALFVRKWRTAEHQVIARLKCFRLWAPVPIPPWIFLPLAASYFAL